MIECNNTSTLERKMRDYGLGPALERAIKVTRMAREKAHELRNLPVAYSDPLVTAWAGMTVVNRGKVAGILLHPLLGDFAAPTLVHEAAHALVVMRVGALAHEISGAHGFLWRLGVAAFGDEWPKRVAVRTPPEVVEKIAERQLVLLPQRRKRGVAAP